MTHHRLHRGALSALSALVLVLLAGCSGAPRGATTQNQRNWDAIGARYQRYIEADRSLNADDKRIRVQELDEAKKLAAEMSAQSQ